MLIIRSWPCLKCTFILYAQHSVLKLAKLTMPQGPRRVEKMRDVSKRGWGGGSPGKRRYDIFCGQNRYVTLP